LKYILTHEKEQFETYGILLGRRLHLLSLSFQNVCV